MLSRPCARQVRKAFTLIELLVVIAIIAILIALLVPAVQKVRDAAARTQCINNMKQLALGLHGYHDTNKKFPPGAWGPDIVGGINPNPNKNNIGYAAFILPFIEQTQIYANMKLDQDYTDTTKSNNGQPAVLGASLPLFLCPSGPTTDSLLGPQGAKSLHYLGIMGAKSLTGQPYPFVTGPQGGYPGNSSPGNIAGPGVLGINSKNKIADITDGTSNTLLLGELSWKDALSFGPWSGGWDGSTNLSAKNVAYGINTTGAAYNGSNYNDVCFGSPHSGGASFASADGGVHFITDSVSFGVFQALATMDRKEIAAMPE